MVIDMNGFSPIPSTVRSLRPKFFMTSSLGIDFDKATGIRQLATYNPKATNDYSSLFIFNMLMSQLVEPTPEIYSQLPILKMGVKK